MRERFNGFVKFVTGKAEIPQENLPYQGTFDPKQFAERLMDRLKKGDPYRQVPEEYRSIVDGLIATYYPTYKDSYPKKAKFAKDMARNWLAKYTAFPEIAKRNGLHDIQSNNAPALNDATMLACLTANSSYVLLGPGAMTQTGGALRYSRIPLRQEKYISDISVPAGAQIEKPPHLGKGLTIQDKDKNKAITTSPLIAICAGTGLDNITQRMNQFQGTLKLVSTHIDNLSFLNRK